MTNKGGNFEHRVVESFNFHLKENGIAFRLKQAEYTNQIIDILIDSFKYGNICIECKSIKDNVDKLYFSSRFTDDQVEGISEFIKKSGRKGFLFIELRNGRGNKNIVKFFKWETIIEKYLKKEKSLDINKGITINQINGYYDLGGFFKNYYEV